MSSEQKQFELIFEGAIDESPETARKLRTSLLADAGLSVTDAVEALNNAPKTIRTAELEEELKPIYGAIKKAGGKVLIVSPQSDVTASSDGYFLDLEQTALTDDLLASLESIAAEKEEVPDQTEKAYVLDINEDANSEGIALQISPSTAVDDESQTTHASANSESSSSHLGIEDISLDPISLIPELLTKSEPTPLSPSVIAPSGLCLNEDAQATTNTDQKATPIPPTPSSAIPSEPIFDLSITLEEAPQESTNASPSEADADDFSKAELSDSLSESISADLKADPKPKKPSPQAENPLSFDAPETPTPQIEESKLAWNLPSSPPASATFPSSDAIEQQYSPPPHKPHFAYRQINSIQANSGLLVPILIGTVFLGTANWFYFHGNHGGGREISFSIPDGADSQEQSQFRTERLPRPKRNLLHGKAIQSNFQVQWSLAFDKQNLVSISFELSTPQPPEPTAEEIVHSVKPKAWLRKIEISDVPVTKLMDSSYQVKSQARVFIEEGPNKRRIPASIEINIKEGASVSSAEIGVTLTRGYNPDKLIPNFAFERLPNGDFRLAYKADLSANKDGN